jgi:hypothetical protein
VKNVQEEFLKRCLFHDGNGRFMIKSKFGISRDYVKGLFQKKKKRRRNSHVDLLRAAYPPYLM